MYDTRGRIPINMLTCLVMSLRVFIMFNSLSATFTGIVCSCLCIKGEIGKVDTVHLTALKEIF